MARTTALAVASVLVDSSLSPNGQGDYDGTTDLTPYIVSASSVVDRVATAASDIKGITLSTTELELIERWLAAHFYTKMDPTYLTKTTGKAVVSFARNPKVPEPYKDVAIAMDYSGMLNAILNRQSAGGFWMGKTVPDQLSYTDRN
jgi:hypothetical protein